MKVWRVLRDLSLGFLTFILDDTGVWVEYRDTNSERNFWEYPKNNKPHIFTPPRPLGSGGVKIWGLLFFFKKYKIGNNDFTTILVSVNVQNMTPTTICPSNPTENVLGGSIDHTESSWTLNNTSILLTSDVDLIFGFQKQIYHISDIFQKWISTWNSGLRIRIHRIVTYIYEIHQFFDETYSSCVTFIPYYQLGS